MPGPTWLELITTNLLLKGTTAQRPAVADVPKGTLYANTTTGTIQQNDGTSWVTYFAPSGATVAPAARITRTTAQSIPNDNATPVAFTTKDYDTDAMVDLATYDTRITIKTAGIYITTAQYSFAANATGLRGVRILLNTTLRLAMSLFPGSSLTDNRDSLAAVASLAVNDYLTLEVYQDSGGSLDLNPSSTTPASLAASKIGTSS